MIVSRAAYRYARSLYDVAEAAKRVDAVDRDLSFIEKLAVESREFDLFLKSPVINAEKKKSIITDLFKARLDELTFKFIVLLASRNREGLLPQIANQFAVVRDERMGIVNAILTSVIPLSKEQEGALRQRLEQKSGKKVRFRPVLDPLLKGGFRVQIGDTVWDGSVVHQLGILRERFLEGNHARA